MIKVGIIGSTGYAGVEIVRLITQHKYAEVVWFGSRSYVDQRYADFPGWFTNGENVVGKHSTGYKKTKHDITIYKKIKNELLWGSYYTIILCILALLMNIINLILQILRSLK